MQGNVKQYGCDAILCPPQTFNNIGYRHSLASGCEPCSQHTIAPFYGSTKCAVTPRGILSLLYLSTNGQNWKRSNYWMTNHTICNWYGITCDPLSSSSRLELVTRVELGSNGLSGTVPIEIFQLQALEILDLSNNKIDLKFTDIGQATRLDVLNLNATEITSMEEIGQARGLSQLNLQNNDFQGSTIPSELYNIFGLETLLLSGSKLSGSIARQVGYLTSLRQLQISRNQITGSIPSEIGWLKSLKILDLSENDITGTLPSTLNKLSSLIEFHMSCFTRSEGCISGNLLRFSELSNLKLLNLGGNNIAGSIPYDFLQSSSKVQKVTLTSNKLTGTIPSSFSTFVSSCA
jgi:Leucine-rich repeat (LRR) protein